MLKREVTAQSRSGHWFILLLSIGASFAILANGLSHMVVQFNPELALAVNPLNVVARIRLLKIVLKSETGRDQASQLKNSAETGLKLEPIDARFSSVLGIIEEKAGNPDRAQKLYLHSLQLSPTEIQALIRRFTYAAPRGMIDESINLTDLIVRRWLKYWKILVPYLPGLLTDEKYFQQMLVRMPKIPRGEYLMVNSLIGEVSGMESAIRLVKSWFASGKSDLRPSINLVIAKLLTDRRNTEAYGLFRETLYREEISSNGYIFNGSFRNPTNLSPFDWSVRVQPGMGARIKQSGCNLEQQDGKPLGCLELRFLNNPIRLSYLMQTMKLPPAQISLSFDYAMIDFKSPKPLQLLIECKPTRKVIALLNFKKSSGTFSSSLRSTFKVPDQNCALQTLRLVNNVTVESWRNRTAGMLQISNVSAQLEGI